MEIGTPPAPGSRPTPPWSGAPQPLDGVVRLWFAGVRAWNAVVDQGGRGRLGIRDAHGHRWVGSVQPATRAQGRPVYSRAADAAAAAAAGAAAAPPGAGGDGGGGGGGGNGGDGGGLVGAQCGGQRHGHQNPDADEHSPNASTWPTARCHRRRLRGIDVANVGLFFVARTQPPRAQCQRRRHGRASLLPLELIRWLFITN